MTYEEQKEEQRQRDEIYGAITRKIDTFKADLKKELDPHPGYDPNDTLKKEITAEMTLELGERFRNRWLNIYETLRKYGIDYPGKIW